MTGPRYDARMNADVTVIGDPAAFTQEACTLMREAIVQAIAERGRAVIGLSGGSTPGPVYEALGKEQGIEWGKVWIFLCDDRHIRADDPKSNQFLLRSTLLKNAPVPDSHLIFPDTSLSHQECVDLYDRHLTDLLKKGPADLVTLGMGDDGHIASLFPPLADEAFGPRHAIMNFTDKFDVHERISVTLPVLSEARQKLFLLKGESKKKVWEEMTTDKKGPNRWPAKALADAVVIGQW